MSNASQQATDWSGVSRGRDFFTEQNQTQPAPPPASDQQKAQEIQKSKTSPKREPRKLRGSSIIDYAERQIDSSKNLLGNRWLSRQCGAFIVAPSGHGKSTLVIQAALCWSCNRVAFRIKPPDPLRILILQSEDDDNDIIEMAWMIERLGLTESEKALVRKNTHVEWLNDVTGSGFFPVVDEFLSQFPADILVINPYTAYQGGNIRNDELNNEFLRVRLSALLAKHNCGALPIHHTPKTSFQNTDKFSWYDWMYSMAGGAALTNWARGVLVIVPSDVPGTYLFIAAKRFEKIGWTEREYWYSHSITEGKMLWLPSSQDQIASAHKGRQAGPDDLLICLSPIEPKLEDEIIVTAKAKLNIGRDKTRSFLKVLVEHQKVEKHEFPRPHTNPQVKYTRNSTQ